MGMMTAARMDAAYRGVPGNATHTLELRPVAAPTMKLAIRQADSCCVESSERVATVFAWLLFSRLEPYCLREESSSSLIIALSSNEFLEKAKEQPQ